MNRLFLLLLPLALAGCDPFERPGTWALKSAGLNANETNLRAMLANPADASRGKGEADSLAAEARPPVRRLLTNTRTPLPSSEAAQIGVSGNPAPVQPAPAANATP
jgi:hypothetical protein